MTVRAPPDGLIITDALRSRRAKAPDYRAETKAWSALALQITREPTGTPKRFVDLVLDLCHAGSAGISLLETSRTGAMVFRWAALAGILAPYVGRTTPEHPSPSGLCIQRGETTLIRKPDGAFEYPPGAHDPIQEILIVPIYDVGNAPLGTVWVASHGTHQFDSNDARILEELSTQVVLGLKRVHRTRKERKRKERADRDQAELRQSVEEKDTVIREVHHRVKNTLQISAALLAVQANSAPTALERDSLLQANARLGVLARIHEMLYQSADNAQVVDMTILLSKVAEANRALFPSLADAFVEEITQAPLPLHADLAIPLALIANEAITNACKHAFPDKPGTVRISLRPTRSGGARLSIADTGVGIPQEKRTGSIGLRLMRNLAQQIGADLDMKSGQGTTITVELRSSGLNG